MKHKNNETHQALTEQGNTIIIENFYVLA